MSWMPPPPPRNKREFVVAYWQDILAIPENEPGAAMLREMATQRLVELGAVSRENANSLSAEQDQSPTNR